MAALDILQEVAGGSGATNPVSVTFSAVNANELLVFAFMTQRGDSIITPPSGLTLAADTAGGAWPQLKVYTRVAQGGDSLSWSFSSSSGDDCYLRGFRIEGAFANLSGVTSSVDSSFSAVASRAVLVSNVTVAANTLVLAALSKSGTGNVSTVTNSFASLSNQGTDRKLSTARRLYTSSATDVSTTFSWTGNEEGNTALIRIAAPSGSTVARSVFPFFLG